MGRELAVVDVGRGGELKALLVDTQCAQWLQRRTQNFIRACCFVQTGSGKKQSSHLLDGAVLVDGEVVVAQLRSPAAVDQNVGGFDISVDDTVLVQVLQPIRHV